MQRAVWLGWFLGIALVGPASQSDAKTISFRCMIEYGKKTFVFNIKADDRNNSVRSEVFTRSQEQRLQFHQVREYTEGAYANSLQYERVESLDGKVLDGADNHRKGVSSHQHVLIREGKIQFGPDNSLVTIDMGGGGIIKAANGKTGLCDYAK